MRNLIATPAQLATVRAYPYRLPGIPCEPTNDTRRALAMVAALVTTHGRSFCGRMWGE